MVEGIDLNSKKTKCVKESRARASGACDFLAAMVEESYGTGLGFENNDCGCWAIGGWLKLGEGEGV